MKNTKAKKILIIFIMLILLISGTAIIQASTIENPTVIEFEDRVLYEMIVTELTTKPNDIKIQVHEDDETIPELGIKLSDDDLKARKKLNLQGMNGYQIQNLSGIESFTSLEELNLSSNAITNMETVTQLAGTLKSINLSGNDVTGTNILNTISQLTNLTTLNMSNTKLDSVSTLRNLNKLQTVNLSGNNLADLTPISTLLSITKLDISNNTSFPTISQIQSLIELTELNISNTGITTLGGIQYMEKLEKLYASNITGLQKDNNRLDALYTGTLTNLKVLDLSNSGITETKDAEGNVLQQANQAKISFSDMSVIASLEELYLENMGISNLGGIANLVNLKILDLANNKIKSENLEDIIIEKNDVVQTENVMMATKIELQNNNIIDISIFGKYPANIQYLDLRNNHIYNTAPLSKHSLSQRIDLRNQDIQFSIYDKAVDVNHYIVLPEIFQSNKIRGSIVYSENDFTTTGMELNSEYTNPGQYNVIISPEKTKNDLLTIKINGGNANGTILKYVVGLSAGSSHNEYVTESLYFNDSNLYQAVVDEINNDPQGQGYNKYIGESFILVPQKIININRVVIDKMELIYFDSKSIKDLTGLENCSKITDLYLNNNDIISMKPLEACTKMVRLMMANNKNMGDNNTAIEKMPNLSYLDLSNTGMTNINNINNYINSISRLKLVELNISKNGLQDITGIEKIISLQKLYIADEALDNEDLEVVKNLTGLTTLDISGNQISVISALSNLPNLTYLCFNNNKVESIEPLAGKIFTHLEFSGNKIKDITPLSSHNSINTLMMENNQIEDASVLDNILISDANNFSMAGQKITKIIDENETGEISIQLPQIFKAAKTTGNKLYTNTDLVLTNCKLDATGNNIIIDLDSENLQVAQVTINGGKAFRSVLTIVIPLLSKIEYSVPSETITNQDVTATITFNRSKVTISNNDGESTYKFTQNGEFTFEYYDEYGIQGTATAVVNNIDKDAPTITGVEDGKVYKTSVTPVIQDKNLKTVTLTKDGVNVENYLAGAKIEEIGKYVLTAVDIVDNTKTVSFEIQEPSDIITSENDVITVTEEKNLIRGIEPKTTVQKIKQNLNSEMSYVILDKNGQSVSDSSKIGTGCQIKMANGKTYTIIVWGDLTGDGEISIAELARISRIASTASANPSELEILAIDVSKDNSIKVNDLAAISRMKNQK